MSAPPQDPIHVIGHRNPDTDAICSAIGYAAFLRDSRGDNAIPARCGDLSVRTEWALNQASIAPPKLLMDVRPTAQSIAQREVISASPDDTFLSVYRKMAAHQFRSVPVVNADGKLLGMPTLLDLGQLILPPDDAHAHNAANRTVRTSLRNMALAVGGTLCGDTTDAEKFDDFLLVVAASSLDTSRKRAQAFPARLVATVTGDRPEIHELAMELRTRCLIITGGFQPSAELQKQATERGVAIVCSPHDTASTSQLVRFSRPIADALHDDFLCFGAKTPLKEIIAAVHDSHQPLFPVIDDNTGALLGVFSKSDLVDVPRAKLVLVDHNEFSQAVTGADEADIVEVIDHHRLSGNLRTKEPVRFINEPVGSTSTIVAMMYRLRNMQPDQATALCLCAGMISDTLNLTSPTTTDTDREILPWLAGIADIDVKEFTAGFFAAGSMLKDQPASQALESDRKEFDESGWRFSLSQIEELGLSEFWKQEDTLHAALTQLVVERKLHFAGLLVTDITRHDSVFIVAGDARVASAIEYPQLKRGVFELKGVVSRKKQLLPYVCRLVGKMSAD
ncbi:MAG: putative manganese-dependent inorganic diphosphatase [Verrucomicrobia bacterium]|nr:putative manganese-dependent inorganic diphosphatase [Verrucomicrobiota bacterium]